MHIHDVKLVNLEHNAAYEPLEYAVFIDFMLTLGQNANFNVGDRCERHHEK